MINTTVPFVSHFTPSLMSHEALEEIFVQRELLAERVIEHIRDSALTATKHYTLLIGPRGIGKTHLIALTYYRVRAMDDLKDHLWIAWMREEEWGISSFLDFLLRIFRALEVEYPEKLPHDQVEALYVLSAEEAEHQAAELLKAFIGDRTLLVLIENLDDVFKGLADEGQKRLRSFLQENPICTILATAQALFNGISRQTSPFYNFFHIQHLSVLQFEDATRLLKNIAELKGDSALSSFIQTPSGRARIRAVHHLTGGNHRVYIIFSQFISRDSLDELVHPFMSMLDELTPYYQSRMASLSPQQRKIVEFLCDRRGAVPVKEIAQRGFMEHQTVTSQLQKLRELGYVHSTPIGRESYYELHEPLMRLCIEVKKNRGGLIQLFVDFLRIWYSPDELKHHLHVLESEDGIEREYVLNAIQVNEAGTQDPRVKACLEDFRNHLDQRDWKAALDVAEDLTVIRGNPSDWAKRGHCAFHLRCWPEALKSYDKVIERKPNDRYAWEQRVIALVELGRHKEAQAAIKKVKQFNPIHSSTYLNLGLALAKMERHQSALQCFNKALELDPQDHKVWYYHARSLSLLNRNSKALVSIDRAIELKSDDENLWRGRGLILDRLKRYAEALEAFDRALANSPTDSHTWYLRGSSLASARKPVEALASFAKAVEYGETVPCLYFERVECLLELDRWDESYLALKEALNQHGDDALHVAGHTQIIIRRLLRKVHDEPAQWPDRIAELVMLYDRHNILPALGQGLVQNIPLLKSKTARLVMHDWISMWSSAARTYKELNLPIRLLDAAICFIATQDQRFLLELPIEERTLLNELLKQQAPNSVRIGGKRPRRAVKP